MANLHIEIPEDILIATSQSSEEFLNEAKFFLAAKLFDLGRLSSGRAAQLCGMNRVDFLLRLHTVGVSAIQIDEQELEEELRDVREG
jgi:predicted HTH domain antitoxin